MSNESPTPASNRRPQRIVLVLVVAVLAPIAASTLYANPPGERVGLARFYPGCWFHEYTGWHCPGCGATRAVYALLHADLPQAFAWNQLFVILGPGILYGLWQMGYSAWTGRKAPGRTLSRRSSMIFIAVLVAYWIARNIPIEPVNPLAPHPLSQSVPQVPSPAPTP